VGELRRQLSEADTKMRQMREIIRRMRDNTQLQTNHDEHDDENDLLND
jgi:hypothetical protein